MGRRTVVDQSAERALIEFLRERAQPAHQVIVNHYADALDLQAAWADVPEERARRTTLAVVCRCLAVEWCTDAAFDSRWMPAELAAAS